jgi:hypothetical protein
MIEADVPAICSSGLLSDPDIGHGSMRWRILCKIFFEFCYQAKASSHDDGDPHDLDASAPQERQCVFAL